jgi:hypothetical protein
MRIRLLCFFVICLGLAAGGAARAQSPPNQVIAGQMQAAFAQNSTACWTYVTQGASEIQIGGMPTHAVISFPELIYWDGAYHPLNGQARLVFTSSNAGNVRFKLWGSTVNAINAPTFSGFAQTYNGVVYTVSFNINFPNSCTLAIYGNYESP